MGEVEMKPCRATEENCCDEPCVLDHLRIVHCLDDLGGGGQFSL